MNPLTNSFFAGACYLLAGTFGLVRHFLLEPGMQKYPPAPPWLLHVFFGFSAVLIYAGLRFLTVWATGEGSVIPPGATNMGVLLAASLMIYKGALMGNVLYQRYPADVWRRINRLTAQARHLARCPRKF